MRTLEDALSFVRQRKVVPFTDVNGKDGSFVRAVVGGPVRGSWWGHPKGKLIFHLSSALGDSGEVLFVKLVAGKVTLVHETLWPALARVVTDAGWRRARTATLGRDGRRLLQAVEKAGELRLDHLAERWGVTTKDDRRALAKAKDELEKKLIVHVGEVHTESGNHVSLLEPWTRWGGVKVRKAAAKLSFDGALAKLEEACGELPTGLA